MTDVHTLAGAYVLDAVNDLERAAFQHHLHQCDTCALEVAELRETASRLSDATWEPPPPRLRDAVRARIALTPQARPVAAGRGRAAAPAGWRRWTAAAVAAGTLAAGAGAATYLLQEQRVRDERERAAVAQQHADRLDAVLAAPDAALFQEPATGAGTVTVVGSRVRDEAVVVLSALPAPGAGQAYQLWLGTGGELVSAGVLPAGVGTATALVSDFGDADLVGVSLEPATGSPTGQPSEGRIVATVPMT